MHNREGFLQDALECPSCPRNIKRVYARNNDNDSKE